MDIIKNIKKRWQKDKVGTGLVLAGVTLAALSFIKPGYTEGLLSFLGMTLLNISLLVIAAIGIWYFLLKKD